MKRWHTLLIGLLISAVALYFALRNVDLAEAVKALRTARYGYVALACVLVVATTYLRGVRWRVLTQGRLTAVDGFWLFNIGFLFNNVLPVRLGELARAYLAGRHPKMHFTSALSSIIVERLLDMVSVVALLGGLLFGLDLPPALKAGGAAMGGIALAGIVILAITARNPDGILRVAERLADAIPGLTGERVTGWLGPFAHGLAGVTDLRVFVVGLGLSLFGWLFSGFMVWVLMLAFWSRVPVSMGLLAVVAAGLGVSIPSAPSGIGPYQAAVYVALTAVGFDPDVSTSFAFVMHAMGFVMTSLLGALGLVREGVSFREVARAAQGLREQPQVESGLETPTL